MRFLRSSCIKQSQQPLDIQKLFKKQRLHLVNIIKYSIKVSPYAQAISVKSKYFDVTKTVNHISREFSRHAYFFIEKGEGWITGKALFFKYQQ